MLKTLLFIIIVFFAVRWVSRLFLPGGKRKSNNFRFFYQTFKDVREQQKQHQKRKQQQRTRNGKVQKNDLDNIEEAEYEEVNDDTNDK